MPSQALKSLIDTFENLESPAKTEPKSGVILAKATQINSSSSRQENDFLDSSTSPTASTLSSFQPMQPKSSSSRSETSSITSTQPSLIDAQDLDFLDVKLEHRPSTSPLRPLRTIPSVEIKKAPPPLLPPRRSDIDALPTNGSLGNSLVVNHSYPPVRPGSGEKGHVPASSISSFHSVSLSSDGGNRESMNMEESLEFLNIPSIPPTPARPGSQTRSAGPPPKVPPRPASTPINTSYAPYTKKRAPPPPPPTFPKRKTSLTTPSKTSAIDTKNTSSVIDAKARERYDALFDRNLEVQNKRKAAASQQKGWRGKSAALLKNPPPPIPATRLDRHIVKAIWECSHLNKYQLRRIW